MYHTDSDESNEPLRSLELTSGLTFTSWDKFKDWINKFALQEGFDYRIRTSEAIQGVIRRVTYECTKSGSHIPQVISDPTRRRDVHSQRISCP